jgi:hypothetical protein
MSDLASGRYPDSYAEWLLDGQPSSPYRATCSRTAVTGAAVTGAATQVPYVVACPVEPGDVFNYVSFSIGTLAGTAGNSSFVVVYSATPTASAAATVVGVSATTTFVAGANKIQLTGAVQVGTSPAVYGVAIVEAWTTTGSQFDGVAGGASAFKGVIGSQVVLATKLPTLGGTPPTLGASSGTTVTAPSTGFVPYIVLSRT